MGKISTRVYIIAGILTALVFLGGVSLGWFLDYNRVYTVESQMNSLQLDFQNLQLENLFISALGNNSTCSLYSGKAVSLSAQTDKLASDLDDFSNINQFQADTLANVKKRYTLLNLEFWMQLTNLQKTCGYNATTLLYFYTVDPNRPCDECVAQGLVLDAMKKQAPEKMMIFAVDYNLDLGIVKALITTYNITSTPSIIVNSDMVVKGFANQSALGKYLK
ncbi:hypothetical protein EPN87_04460 [archaeon]|nr:MAG: hypothetical protein EPN87_04460 [archaeon]